MSKETIRILTRDSFLALAQTIQVSDYLMENDFQVEIKALKTAGDIKLDAPLYQISQFSESGINKEGKAYFTKELEDGLLEKKGDMAVHSLKDLPTSLPDGLAFATPLMPVEPSDTIVTLNKLPDDNQERISILKQIVIGSSSLRRIALLNKWLPGVQLISVRGNLVTRFEKLINNKEPDALVLATAGIRRLYKFYNYWKANSTKWEGKLDSEIIERLNKDYNRLSDIFNHKLYFYEISPEIFPPAVSQGVLGIESSDSQKDKFKEIFYNESYSNDLISKITLERTLLSELEAGCHIPYGNLVTLRNKENQKYFEISSFYARNYQPDEKEIRDEFNSKRNLPLNFPQELCENLIKEVKGEKYPVVLCGLENKNFINSLKSKGFQAYHIPLIESAEVSQNEEALQEKYDAAIVASKNCVDFFPEKMPQIQNWIAVGQKTAEYLKDKLNIKKVLIPEINSGIEAGKMALSLSSEWKNFLWFGAQNGKKDGIEYIKGQNKNIDVYTGYETKPIELRIPDEVSDKNEFLNKTSYWVFTSPSSAKSYLEQNLFRKSHLISVIGYSTASVFFQNDIIPYHISSESNLDIMAEEISGKTINSEFKLNPWSLS